MNLLRFGNSRNNTSRLNTARLATFFLALLFPLVAHAAPICPSADSNFGPFYDDAGQFRQAITAVAGTRASNRRLTGITVPHHLLAADLMALGLHVASGFSYKRIVLLSPDHFHRSKKPFATTRRSFDTVFGPVKTDGGAVATLARHTDMVEVSCLFAQEHGVLALLPFLRHYFPDAEIVPVAMSAKARRADWDRLAEALKAIVDSDTLIVESTDFSHFLPQHEARRYDQQTLNLLSAGALDGITALNQPNHADSVGALYVQAKLQAELFDAHPLVVANENSQERSPAHGERTTSYMVVLFGAFDAGFNNPTRPKDRLTYLAGDVNFGRAMKKVLLRDGVTDAVAHSVLSITGGRPLVINLEGVVLPNVPEAIDGMTLAMPRELTIDVLKRLNVVGVGLANNHAFDLGPSGYAETLSALDAAGIAHFGQGEALALPDLDIVGLTDIDTNGSLFKDLVTPALLDRLVRPDAKRPVIAFVHWGREYITEPSAREDALADAMRLRSVSVIAGGHPHVSSGRLVPLAGGDTVEVYSLGNFLFDQGADRASGAMLEVRVFAQGTIFCRLIPLPNYFDFGRN